MSFYKCGHDRRKIFFKKEEENLFIKYEVWRTGRGFLGNKSMCWDCFVKLNKGVKK